MRHLALLFLFASCSESVSKAIEPPEAPQPEEFPELLLDGDGTFGVPSTDPERPRLRYRDGQLSMNQTCAIRLPNKLNPAIPPMYVNGAPIGFC